MQQTYSIRFDVCAGYPVLPDVDDTDWVSWASPPPPPPPAQAPAPAQRAGQEGLPIHRFIFRGVWKNNPRHLSCFILRNSPSNWSGQAVPKWCGRCTLLQHCSSKLVVPKHIYKNSTVHLQGLSGNIEVSHTLEDAVRSVEGPRELGNTILLSKCVTAACPCNFCLVSKYSQKPISNQ